MPNDLVPHVKIAFFGTSDFAIPAFEALLEKDYAIVAAITNPDEPAGRGQDITSPPVKILAKKYGIPVFQPEKLEREKWKSEIPSADIFIIAAYGKIIPKDILEIPKFGTLNIHPSLLPRWRGPSPIQYAILNGDKKTGVTIMLVDEKMDHGPVLARQELDIGETRYQELHSALSRLGAALLLEILPQWLQREIAPVPQDDTKATYSKLIKKDDARIDWKKPAREIERTIRALNPKPGTWTIWPRADALYRIRIEEGAETDDEAPYGAPGYVWRDPGHIMLVKTGKGSVAIRSLTLEGKKLTDSASFIHGHPDIIGSNFI